MLFSYSTCVWAFAIAILSTDASSRGKPRSTCREPTVFQNIDLPRVMGQWYVYSHHDHDFERGCDCFTSEAIQTDVNTIQISSCCQMSRVSNETQTCNISVNGARLTNPEKKEAMFLYTRAGVTVESQMWVVDTDYVNYMIVNACERVSDEEERELFWILSRDSVISRVEAKKIDDVLEANHFEMDKIIKMRHEADICKSKRPQRGHGNQGNGNEIQ
ncbi:apolipoprotein D-like [Bradysia coprophila]|uniref:apolipoprotein D-like n=1 Tax=Bradysia coprophila TaxID=38358 RepID=UPI00187D757C|nr:apolipoprotein D-like [Bradysia coprophila]